MSKYVVIGTVEREIMVLGQTDSREAAWECMKQDFDRVFYEKYKAEASYEERADESKCWIDLDTMTAYINNCNRYDYGWKVCELPEEQPKEPREVYHLLSWNDEYLSLCLEPTDPFDLTKEEAKAALKEITLKRLVELRIVADEEEAEALYAKAEACEYPDMEPEELHVGLTENTICYSDAEERICITKEPVPKKGE